MGYKNSRRGTTFAAQSAGQSAALKAKEFGFQKVRVKLKGLGSGREVMYFVVVVVVFIVLPWRCW